MYMYIHGCGLHMYCISHIGNVCFMKTHTALYGVEINIASICTCTCKLVKAQVHSCIMNITALQMWSYTCTALTLLVWITWHCTVLYTVLYSILLYCSIICCNVQLYPTLLLLNCIHVRIRIYNYLYVCVTCTTMHGV